MSTSTIERHQEYCKYKPKSKGQETISDKDSETEQPEKQELEQEK